jgi:hypothetical protein
VYTFKLEAYASVDALWLDFAKSVRYCPRRHRDVIFAARLNADDTEGAGYMLAHKRDDQRKFEAPPYLARYTPSIGNRGCGNTDLAILGALCDVGCAQRANLAVVHPGVPTPLEVLATLSALPDRRGQLERVAAKMTPPKERTYYQQAVVSCWEPFTSLLKLSEEPAAYEIRVESDAAFPRLSSYGRVPFAYTDIELPCE